MAKLLKIIMEDISEDITGAKPVNKDEGVTYNEGNGRQDTVVMTGPLSGAFTKALNLYFAKKDITNQDEGDILEDQTDSASVAAESVAIDSIIKTNLTNHFARKEFSNFINLVSDSEEFEENPTAIIMTTDMSSALKPEVVDLMESQNDLYKDSDKEVIAFIGPNIENDSGLGNVFVELDNKTNINMTNAGDTFKRATEALYTTRGIKVVVGFESLVEWLKTRQANS